MNLINLNKFKIGIIISAAFSFPKNYFFALLKKYFINHDFQDREEIWSDAFNNYFSVLSKENSFILTRLNLDELKKENNYIYNQYIFCCWC